MLGELDYAAIFSSPFDEEKGVMSDDNWNLTHHETLVRLVFLSFSLMIAIVLMNLLVGLTVGDVDQINREAETQKWQRNIAFADYAGDAPHQLRPEASWLFTPACSYRGNRCADSALLQVRAAHSVLQDPRHSGAAEETP